MFEYCKTFWVDRLLLEPDYCEILIPWKDMSTYFATDAFEELFLAKFFFEIEDLLEDLDTSLFFTPNDFSSLRLFLLEIEPILDLPLADALLILI